jgi:Uma2 family endonuclease
MYNDNNCSFNPLAVLEPVKEPRRYTLAEYLKREERAKEPNEYYNGLITKRTMAKGPHNMVVANMTAELIFAFRANRKKYAVFGSQQLIYLPEFNFSLYPDVLAVAETPQYWDKNDVLLINPLLIVEVLSKSTSKYDRTGKFEAYKTLPSFQEYVLINPEKCQIEVRFREAHDLWRNTNYTNMSDIIKLKSIGCEIDISLIYANITFKK